MNKPVIVHNGELGFIMSLQCDNCNFALITGVVFEEMFETIETGLRQMLPYRHTCEQNKGENK